jgi:hypothetical protein
MGEDFSLPGVRAHLKANDQDLPFTAVICVADFGNYDDTVYDGDVPILGATQKFEMGLSNKDSSDGSQYFYANIVGSAGQSFRSTMDLTRGMSYHIAMIWDGQQLQLALNGKFKDSPLPAPGPSSAIQGEVWVGGPAQASGQPPYCGSIRCVGFWDKALSREELRDAVFRYVPAIDRLLIYLEFSSYPPTVQAPRIPDLQNFTLPSSRSLLMSGRALALSDGGSFCTYNSSSVVHFEGRSEFTVEAWVAPMEIDADKVYMILNKDGPSSAVGYKLSIMNRKLTFQRG